MYNLISISVTNDFEYEVVFQKKDKSTVTIICEVEYDGLIEYIKPKPDIFIEGKVNSKIISKAILAFHKARKK